MNRRNFLRGLLALPLAPLAAKLLPKETCRYVGMDFASGSDSTSIWFMNWGKDHSFRAVEDEKFLALMHEEVAATFMGTPIYLVDKPWDPSSVRIGKRNWLKEKINGH